MINSRFGFVRFEFVCWIRSCILFIVHDADGGMGWFAPVGVKSRYLLAFCYLSIALALLYYFGTVVSAYFTGTCEGARACTTSIPVPYSPRTLPVPVFVAPVFVVRSPQHRRHWGREFSLHDLNAHLSFSLCRTEQVFDWVSGFLLL